MKKGFKIGKLENEKEKFQTYLKEQLIREIRAQILIFQIRTPNPPPHPPPPTLTKKKKNPRRSNKREFDDDEDFLSPSHFFEPTSPRETSFLFSDGSLSPLRNKLPNIAPLPSKPTIDNFTRPITQITDEKKYCCNNAKKTSSKN